MPAAAPVSQRPERLRRALQLLQAGRVKHIRGSQFHVNSGSEGGYYVDLSAEQTCYCKDREERNLLDCKHSLSCRLFRADPFVLKAVADWIAATATEGKK